MTGPGSGGDPSCGLHLTGPQLVIPSRPSPRSARADDGAWKRRRLVGWFTPDRSPTSYPKPLLPRPARVYNGGGRVPPVGTHRPGPQGANTAGHTVGILPPPPPPNMPQAIAPGIWSSRLVQAAIAEATRSQSVSAPTKITAPPARQSLAEPAETAKRKKKKRRAADPLPELPPAGKKLKKKKGKKQFQFGSTTQGDGPPPPPPQ